MENSLLMVGKKTRKEIGQTEKFVLFCFLFIELIEAITKNVDAHEQVHLDVSETSSSSIQSLVDVNTKNQNGIERKFSRVKNK